MRFIKPLVIYIRNTYSNVKNELDDIPESVLNSCNLDFEYWTRANGYPEKKVETKRFFSAKYKSFPTGFLFSKVLPAIKKENRKYKLIDKRTGDTFHLFQKKPIPSQFERREYQEETIEIALRKKRGIIRSATGSGKTAVAARIIRELRNVTLFIVPKTELLYQTIKTFNLFFGEEHVGIIGDSHWEPKVVTVATAQTLWSRRNKDYAKEYFKNVQTLFMDECHRINKKGQRYNTWYSLAMKFPNSYYRIGLSATPGEEGKVQFELLRAATGEIMVDISAELLINQGYLTPAEVQIYDVPQSDIPESFKYHAIWKLLKKGKDPLQELNYENNLFREMIEDSTQELQEEHENTLRLCTKDFQDICVDLFNENSKEMYNTFEDLPPDFRSHIPKKAFETRVFGTDKYKKRSIVIFALYDGRDAYYHTWQLIEPKGGWQLKYRDGIVNNVYRNKMMADIANSAAKHGEKVLISTYRKDAHIERITRYLTEDYRVVSGDVSTKDRQQYYAELANGDTSIIIGTVVKEGLDIPEVGMMIIAGSLKSDKKTIQQAGRALRLAEGKEKAYIIDFYDTDGDTLEKWSKQRIQTYNTAGYPVIRKE